MTIFTERDGIGVLDGAVDPEGDPLSVTEINGDPALVGTALPLSVGGSITITSDGTASFDDTGFIWPGEGISRFDSLIATVSDGINPVPVSVNIRLNQI